MEIVISDIATDNCVLRVAACKIESDGTIWSRGMPLLVVGHLPDADRLRKKYTDAVKQRRYSSIDNSHFGRIGTFGDKLRVEHAKDYDERMRPIIEAERDEARKRDARMITVHLSSRGWGDYSPLTWNGDCETPADQIVAECQELLEQGHDVDNRNQSDAEIAAKVDNEKHKSREREASRVAAAEQAKKIEAKRKELIDAGHRMATPKQLAVINRACENWFHLFDGAGDYGIDGPTREELRLMTSEKASRLVGQILDAQR